MYELIDQHGNLARMRNGKSFRYSSEILARMGKRYLDKHAEGIFYRIREVTR